MPTPAQSPSSSSQPVSLDPSQDQEMALQRLAESSVAELRFLRVDECEQAIRLSGSVRSFYHKQLAQETVRQVAAGRQVINEVVVG